MATLGLARWSFEQGFLDYINALEESRLQLLTTSMSREYRSAGDSWSKLTELRFNTILWEQSPENLGKKFAFGRPPPPSFTPPRQGFKPPRHGFKPPPFGKNQPPPRSSRMEPLTALFDTNGKLIAGDLPPQEDIKPIRVNVYADGKLVGELQSAPRRHFSSPQETAFSKQQWITSGLIGVVSLVLAAFVSWGLTRIFLAPIRRTILGISQLSSGDYSSRLNEQREDEFGQIMNDLDQLAFKLEENRTSRRRWLADISHELRTPVTVLTGEVEMLKDGIRPLNMDQVLSLDQEISRLRKLIDDLYELSISDIGGLRYSFFPINIRDDLDNAVNLIKNRAQDQGNAICVSGEINAMINADSQRLDQLFTNLLENAIAYSDSPAKIEIVLSKSSQRVSIKIEDTPPGVDQNECDKLFDPLYRLDASRNSKGAGLGLSICRNIVIAHRGTISASPSKLGGLCIEINFPLLTEK